MTLIDIRLVRDINLGEKKMVGVFCQSCHHVKSNRLYSQVPGSQQADFRNQPQGVSSISATSCFTSKSTALAAGTNEKPS